MLLFTHLCVELQRSSFAKDGLYQYRNICKDASLHSFETVVKKFLGRAEDKANVARTESEQTASTLQDIEDLDYMQTPERWSCVGVRTWWGRGRDSQIWFRTEEDA